MSNSPANGISLDGEWRLSFGRQMAPAGSLAQPRIPADFVTIPAIVPGNVELDLVRAQLLTPDLDHGDNIYLLREYESYQWWFCRSFIIDGESPALPVLVLEGVDTIATIWINGILIGKTANMLVPHEFALDGILQAGSNEIHIAIDSAVLESRSHSVEPGSYAHENNWDSLHIRKAPHGYGWDIMPRAVSAGLWKSVTIEFRSQTRFSDVYLTTLSVDASASSARLLAFWNLAEPRGAFVPVRNVRLRVVEPADGRVVHEKHIAALGPRGEFRETIPDIELWYPRGYGRAALYDVQLALLEGDVEVATWHSLFGFRTVGLRNSEIVDAAGSGEFQFVVNGIDVFIKGSNWVPLDALHSRDPERVDAKLALVADLNCNMLRCWGGNVYEGRRFFEFCDREGVMVWQDFALACALYPQTPEFHAQIREEAEVIVPLLRNHPSLVLWAGNNEIDQFYPWAKPLWGPNVDDEISRDILPAVCRRLDPQRPYLPSSPYYSAKLWALGDPDAAVEDHLWGPRDDFKGPFYVNARARFASEIGYLGCPARSSLQRMIRPAQLWPWQGSQDWLTHCVRPQPESTIYNYRIPLVASQIEVLFGGAPTELDDFVLASQLSQAEALKFFIEMFRLEKGRRSGVLWWNIKDGWPQISDAIVDYYGTRKIAYHIVRRLQHDVVVMVGEPCCGLHPVVAVNDTATPATIDLEIRLEGSTVLTTSQRTIPANGRLELGSLPAPQVFSVFELEWRGPSVFGENHYVAGPRPFDRKRLVELYRRMLGDGPIDEQIAPLG